ncbi:MAG: glycosyltransferase family 2 protein [Pseudomonadota bacterium]
MKLRLRTRLSLRLERRGLQLRALAKSWELKPVTKRYGGLGPGPVLFSTMRNEAVRLPYFLDYYRRLGIVHFFVVDNGSDDGTPELLGAASDVSVWRTEARYKASRFGVDWLNRLLALHGSGRWVLVADPDEFLVYPYCDTRRLPALIRWLESNKRQSFGTMLLDLYGQGTLAETTYRTGEDPVAAAPWFDANNYWVERNERYHNLWIQGGPRVRLSPGEALGKAPALNKIPLVRWRRSYIYRNSTHDLLPRRLNRVYDHRGGARTSGILLHTKFLDVLTEKIDEEVVRAQHYAGGREYRTLAATGEDTRLWTPQSTRYEGWEQLCDLGLMARGGWF